MQEELTTTQTDGKEAAAGCLLFIFVLPMLLLDAWLLMTAWNMCVPLIHSNMAKVTYVQAVAFDTAATVFWVQYAVRSWKRDPSPTRNQDALFAQISKRLTALFTLGFGWIILRWFLGA